MKKLSMILIIIMLINCVVIYGDDTAVNLADLNSTKTLDTTGYKLYFGDNVTSEDILIKASLSFNRKVITGHIITENGVKLNINGNLKESSQYTLKYEGLIENNKFFEAYIQNKPINKLCKNKSIYSATINIIDKDVNGDIINAESYIVESLEKNELNKFISDNIAASSHYNQTDDAISMLSDAGYQLIYSYGVKQYYGLRTYSTSTAVENRNVVFRIQTKESDFGAYVNNNYPGNTFLSARGTNLNFYLDGSDPGSVYNAINPNSNSSKTFDIPIPIGDYSISIPVVFSSVSVNNSGYSNLNFLTTDTSGWKDDYNTTSSLNAERAKCFVVHVVGGTSRIAKCKIKITFRVGMEDMGGIKTNVYPAFDSGYFSYIG